MKRWTSVRNQGVVELDVAKGAIEGVHGLTAPKQVSRRNVVAETAAAESPGAVFAAVVLDVELGDTPAGRRLVASELKATKRPSALMDGTLLAAFAELPSEAMETRVVAGEQPAGAPMQVSRRKMSATPLLSPATRLVASEAKTTKRPSAEIDGERLAPSGPAPVMAGDTRIVCGAQPAGCPWQVSRMKISSTPVTASAATKAT
jgi:hypothetical protein